jgi:hypothetical protein
MIHYAQRHCEEPTGPAVGRPEDRLRDEAPQQGSHHAALDCFACGSQ